MSSDHWIITENHEGKHRPAQICESEEAAILAVGFRLQQMQQQLGGNVFYCQVDGKPTWVVPERRLRFQISKVPLEQKPDDCWVLTTRDSSNTIATSLFASEAEATELAQMFVDGFDEGDGVSYKYDSRSCSKTEWDINDGAAYCSVELKTVKV